MAASTATLSTPAGGTVVAKKRNLVSRTVPAICNSSGTKIDMGLDAVVINGRWQDILSGGSASDIDLERSEGFEPLRNVHEYRPAGTRARTRFAATTMCHGDRQGEGGGLRGARVSVHSARHRDHHPSPSPYPARSLAILSNPGSRFKSG